MANQHQVIKQASLWEGEQGFTCSWHLLLTSRVSLFILMSRYVPREMHINEDFALLDGKRFKMQIQNLL